MIGNTMATRRRARKSYGRAGVLLSAALLAAAGSTPSIKAATTEYIVVDRNSGLAISGFDPMAYFIERAAVAGKGEFEHRYAGAVWRFCNQGNRDAFAADPDVYMPRFGGYDPVGIGRGAAVPGDPRAWIIVGDRLYLFHTPDNKAAFAMDSAHAIAAADRQWPAVRLTLSP